MKLPYFPRLVADSTNSEAISKPEGEAINKLLTSKRALLWWMALLFIIYALFIGMDLIDHINCWSSGLDFCAYWSSGRAALDHGVQAVYDTNILRKYQEVIFPNKFEVGAPYEYVPFPYPPIFVLPFELFALLPLQASYLIWSGLKLLGFSLYMWFFYRKEVRSKFPWQVLILILFSAPLFNEIRFGQMNLWLAILVGEFVRNMLQGRKFIAGLILALVSIKFQTLVLIVPFMFYKRDLKALLGFTVGMLFIVFGSFALVGFEGIQGFLSILFNSMEGHSAANVQRMANWRMIGETVDRFIYPSAGIYFVVVGTGLTIIMLVRAIKASTLMSNNRELYIYGLIFLSTTIVTWHSHVEMNMIFTPFILIAIVKKWVSQNIFIFWFILGVLQFVVLLMIRGVITSLSGIEVSFNAILIPLQVVYFITNLRIFFEWTRAAKIDQSEMLAT